MPIRPYRWSVNAGRYIDAQGRFVSLAQVRGALDRALDAAERDARALAIALRDGRISLIAWEREMRGIIKAVHLYSYALSVGGWRQLSAAELGRVGAEVREQYRYLRKFGMEIENNLPLGGRFVARAVMYPRAGRYLQSVGQMEQMLIRGWDQERNIRYSGDSCRGCIEAERAGWVPTGSLPPPGRRDCLGNCRCRMAYRNSVTGATTEGEGARRVA